MGQNSIIIMGKCVSGIYWKTKTFFNATWIRETTKQWSTVIFNARLRTFPIFCVKIPEDTNLAYLSACSTESIKKTGLFSHTDLIFSIYFVCV